MRALLCFTRALCDVILNAHILLVHCVVLHVHLADHNVYSMFYMTCIGVTVVNLRFVSHGHFLVRHEFVSFCHNFFLSFQVSKYLKQQGLDPNDYDFKKTVQNFFDNYDKNDDKVLTLDEFASTHDEL